MHYSQGDFCYPPCCIIPTVTVGSTVTTPPGTRARVTASPTPCGVELDFAIPRGNPGPAAEGYEIHGIDISHYQGKIDWEQLKNAWQIAVLYDTGQLS